MLVFVINLGLARKFSLVPLHNFVAGQRGSIGRDTHLPNSNDGTPVSLRLSLSLPTPYECGECPWQCPLRCPHGILVLRVPFPWAAHAHYTNSVPWTYGLLWPTTPVPRGPSTQCAHFHSHAPSRSIDSCTLQKGSVPSSNTNNKTIKTSFFSLLTAVGSIATALPKLYLTSEPNTPQHMH